MWIVKQMNNLTAYDTFNEDTFSGPTNVVEEVFRFKTEPEAIKFCEDSKSMLRFAGTRGMYYTCPQKEES